MLTYTNIRLAFYGCMVLLFAAYWIFGIHLYITLPLLVFVYLLFISWGCYFIQSGFFLNAVCSGKAGTMEIAITFDDGPDSTVTPEVLDLLKKYQASATFFCIGKNIAGNEGILNRMNEEGHRIGNHSWSHSYLFDFFGDWKVEQEIRDTNEAITKITGREVDYFRPPFGVTNPVIARVVKKLGIPVIGWSIRSYDTTIKNQDKLFERITRQLKGGDIVLFHDSLPRIIPVLKRFLDHCKNNGFTIVSLEQLTGNKH